MIDSYYGRYFGMGQIVLGRNKNKKIGKPT